MRLFGAANTMASVFFSFKSRQRDASHALTSITQRRIRSTADAESPREKSTYNCVFFCRILHTMFSHLRAHSFARSVTVVGVLSDVNLHFIVQMFPLARM